MPGSGQSFVIAGAGITGLTLALGLAKFGATVVVLERNQTIQEAGAGLQISPNARVVLDRLGLGEVLTRIGFVPQALDLYPQGGRKPVANMELGALIAERFGSPYAVMHRADLADALYMASRRFANVDIVFGVRDWDVVSHARGVTVAVDEGDGQSRTIRADAFIGADGVHSLTRRKILGGPDARFGQRIAWRALVPAAAMSDLIDMSRVSVFFGAGFHLVCYPLPHRHQVNLALFMPSLSLDAREQPTPSQPGPHVDAILQIAGQSWTSWPLYTVETDTWSRGNIGLVGDAAHAMVPFQAQGAAMGIEDAAILARILVETKSPESAFQHYARLRQARVRRVAALSAQNGRIFHMPWPLSLARDLVMRAQGPRAHLRRLGWIYDYDAGSAPGEADRPLP